MSDNKQLSGVLPIVDAPFTNDEAIDETSLRLPIGFLILEQMAVALACVPGERFACAEFLSKNLADGAVAFLEGFHGTTHPGQVRPV